MTHRIRKSAAALAGGILISVTAACGSAPSGGASWVTVRSGDSFYRIADRVGVSPQALASANGMTINSTIHPGDRLALPGGGGGGGGSAPSNPAPRSAAPKKPVEDTTRGGASNSRLNLTSAQRNKIVAVGKAQAGKRYVLGDEGPNTFDCSGLVNFAYQSAGAALPRERARDYAKRAVHIPVKDLKPGDLVFFSDVENGKVVIGHVGINIGGGRMVEAASTKIGVRISTFTGRSDLVYGGRL